MQGSDSDIREPAEPGSAERLVPRGTPEADSPYPPPGQPASDDPASLPDPGVPVPEGGDAAPAPEGDAPSPPAADPDVSRETAAKAAVDAFVAASLAKVEAASTDPNFHSAKGWFLPAAAALLRCLCEDGPVNYLEGASDGA